MSDIRIPICQGYIEAGLHENAECCPIALALMDRGYNRVFVDHDEILAVAPDTCAELTYRVDDQLHNWIAEFDSYLSVQPFELLLSEDGDGRPVARAVLP